MFRRLYTAAQSNRVALYVVALTALIAAVVADGIPPM